MLLSFNLTAQLDSLEMHLSVKKDTARVRALNDLAFRAWNICPKKGIRYAKESIQLSKLLKYELGEAAAYNSLGVNQWVLGNYDIALKFYLKSLDINEKFNKKDKIAAVLHNIAIIYSRIDRSDEAIRYYKRVIKINRELKRDSKIASAYMNMSGIYCHTGDYDLGLEYLDKALFINNKSNNSEALSQILYNKASIYLEKEDYVEALKVAKHLMCVDTKINDNVGAVINNALLSKIYLNMKERGKALEYIKKSEKMAKKLDLNTELVSIYELLSRYYEEDRDYKKAFYYSKLKEDLVREIDMTSQTNSINLLKDKSDDLRKQKHIVKLEKKNKNQKSLIIKQDEQKSFLVVISILLAILSVSVACAIRSKIKNNRDLKIHNENINKKTEQLKQSMNELKEANLQKDKFISIIAHDLRNPFNVIIGFSNMLQEDYYYLDEDTRKEYIDRISISSQLTFNLLSDLLLWARSSGQIHLNYESQNLYEFIKKSTNPYLGNAEIKDITIKNNIEKDVFITIDNFTMSTIIANIVSNAIKFTNKKGEIAITYIRSSNSDCILIEDNGIGMCKDKIDSLFRIDKNHSTEGTNKERGTGLGMLLCQEFISKYNGEIRVESELNKGSKFYINIPRNKES